MKKLFLSLLLSVIAMAAAAQIKYVEGSFRDIASGNVAGTDTDLGVTNLSAQSIDWPQRDIDGNKKFQVALIIADFENMVPADIDNVMLRLSDGLSVIKSETKILNGRKHRLYFVQPNDVVDLTFNTDKYGSDRITGVSLLDRHIYTLILRNATTVPVVIDSDPSGARVYFDEKYAGNTPLTIPDVMMGTHNIRLVAADAEIADNVDNHAVDISKINSTFKFPMRKKRDIEIVAAPASAELAIYDANDRLVLNGIGSLELRDLPYGTYRIIGRTVEGELDERYFTVNGNTQYVNAINIIGSRNISFTAMQNNHVVSGATININGKNAGTTPKEIPLQFGTYEIEMSLDGYSTTGTLKVDAKSDGKYRLKLPSIHSTGKNPFDIDYQKRCWGFAINYVNRIYSVKTDGHTRGYNLWGEEKPMNGVQAGIIFQPYFGYGQGLSMGVYWQAFFTKLNTPDQSGIDGDMHSLWIPFEYQFRLPLAENFSIALNGGVAYEFGITNNLDFGDSDTSDSYDLGFNKVDTTYGLGTPSRHSLSWLAGVAIQYKAIQLEAKLVREITDNKYLIHNINGESDAKCKAHSWTVGLSFLF